MDIITPDPVEVLPLFRALHNFHVSLAPARYHADGADRVYLDHLSDAVAQGAHLLAHDVGWGLASYLLARPERFAGDGLRRGYDRWRIDHLYVAPGFRGRRLGAGLVAALETRMRALGIPEWVVTYHADNPGVEVAYARMGARPSIGISARRLDGSRAGKG